MSHQAYTSTLYVYTWGEITQLTFTIVKIATPFSPANTLQKQPPNLTHKHTNTFCLADWWWIRLKLDFFSECPIWASQVLWQCSFVSRCWYPLSKKCRQRRRTSLATQLLKRIATRCWFASFLLILPIFWEHFRFHLPFLRCVAATTPR